MPAGVMGKIELPNFPHTPPATANLIALLLLCSIFLHTLTLLILIQQDTQMYRGGISLLDTYYTYLQVYT